MKKILWIFLAVVVLGGGVAVIFSLKKDTLLTSHTQKSVESLTGTPITLEGVSARWIGRNDPVGSLQGWPLLLIQIKEMRLANPEGFRNKVLARLQDIEAAVQLFPLFSGRWHIPKLSFRLSDVNVERTAQGELNLSRLLPLQGAVLDKPASQTQGAGSFSIGRLEIFFGGRNFFDASIPDQKEPETYDFTGELQVFDGVTHPNVLVQAPAIHLIHQMGKGSLGIPLGKIQDFINQHTGKT